MFMGKVEKIIIGGGENWDAVALVLYPSVASFLSMVSSPEYQPLSKLRTSALSNSGKLSGLYLNIYKFYIFIVS